MLLKLSIHSQDGLVVPGELTNVHCSTVIFIQQTKQGMKICTLRAHEWHQATRRRVQWMLETCLVPKK